MAAPEGNTNAAKEQKGVQVNFYLDIADAEFLRKQLAKREEDVTEKNVRRMARELSRNGIALSRNGKCEVDGCIWAVEIECRIGACAPLKRYCAYHYEQAHLPEDERDES